MSDPVELLDFWITEIGPKGWFNGGDEVDMACRDRFLDLWQAAHDGGLDHWVEGPTGTLAYLILTDQFPRNMFRGDARSFATDAAALAVARRMLAEGWDRQLPTPWHRVFCYLPFEHAESLADQDISVRETTALRADTAGRVDVVEWAVKHREIIARFGRFPHRNAALGRESTVEELAFLKQPGSRF